MKTKAERLRIKEEISNVFKKGKRRKTEYFTLWTHNKKKGPFRVLVITSKKTDKRAVKRNTIRRRVQEIIRKDFQKKLPKTDLIVQLHKESIGVPLKDLKESLTHVLPV
ncbi:MAG: ribonuclease P protein component [bacterium]|nr:ribonuclease P protein component [bacterium]